MALTSVDFTGGQTGSVNQPTNSDLVTGSTGGTATITTNNSNAVDAIATIYGDAGYTAAQIAGQTSQAVGTSTLNPALLQPQQTPAQSKSDIWVIAGVIVGALTLFYMVRHHAH